MMKTVLTLLLAFGIIAGTAEAVFSDSFEGSSLDPFWVVGGVDGHRNSSYSLSSEQAKSGSKSLKLSFNSTTWPDYTGFYLRHIFDTPTQGTYSVWFFDTLYDIRIGMIADDGVTSSEIGVSKFGDQYSYQVAYPSVEINDRSLGWHHYEMAITDTGTTFRLDGTQVGSIYPLTSVKNLALRGVVWANEHHLPGVVYFDDFSFTPIPEPATMMLFGLGGIALWKRRNS